MSTKLAGPASFPTVSVTLDDARSGYEIRRLENVKHNQKLLAQPTMKPT
jgi:hypothetical protein